MIPSFGYLVLQLHVREGESFGIYNRRVRNDPGVAEATQFQLITSGDILQVIAGDDDTRSVTYRTNEEWAIRHVDIIHLPDQFHTLDLIYFEDSFIVEIVQFLDIGIRELRVFRIESRGLAIPW